MTGSARIESEVNNLQQIAVLGKSFKIFAKTFLQTHEASG
jgi:hypothetical protein